MRRTVEEADAVLSIGAWMSDINLGIYTAQIDVGRLIHATADRVRIKRHYFDDVYLGDFIAGLRGALPKGSSRDPPDRARGKFAARIVRARFGC